MWWPSSCVLLLSALHLSNISIHCEIVGQGQLKSRSSNYVSMHRFVFQAVVVYVSRSIISRKNNDNNMASNPIVPLIIKSCTLVPCSIEATFVLVCYLSFQPRVQQTFIIMFSVSSVFLTSRVATSCLTLSILMADSWQVTSAVVFLTCTTYMRKVLPFALIRED